MCDDGWEGGGADRQTRVRVSPPERIRSTTCLWVGGGGGGVRCGEGGGEQTDL